MSRRRTRDRVIRRSTTAAAILRLSASVALGLIALLLLGTPAARAAPGEDPAPVPFVFPSGPPDGPLDGTDRIFLEKVRQAGLWEIPAAQQAQQKGVSQRVKEVGRLIAADHVVLDDDVRRVAARLGVTLPSEATAEQRQWLGELSAKSGEAFDAAFAQRLRFAHGAVYSAIAQVRAGTRNDLMRAFAKHTEVFVNRHMTLLESTGKVDYDQLPEAVVSRGNLRAADQKQPLLLVAVLAVAGVIGAAGVTRALRGTP